MIALVLVLVLVIVLLLLDRKGQRLSRRQSWYMVASMALAFAAGIVWTAYR